MTLADPLLQQHTSDFFMRPPTLDDFDAVAALIRAHDLVTLGEADVDPDELRRDWQLPYFNLESSARVVTTATGSIVGYVAVWNTQAPHIANWVWGCVHPAHWNQGIGTAMFEWAEQRARENISLAPPEARVHLGTEAFYTNHAAQALVANQGLTLTRHFWQMRIELDQEPPAPVWPQGITLRPFHAWDDLEATYLAVDEAFKDHWGHLDRPLDEALQRWRERRESDPHFDPSLYFLAMAGNQLAAFCLCSSQWSGDNTIGFVDILGVRRPWRKMGLGKALLYHAFAQFHQRGKRRAALFVDASNLTGATRLYEAVGMHVHHQWNYYEKELRPGIDLRTKNIQL